ncbi:MAG TPA: hypothetical protein DCQ83_00635 [Fibrobacteres bacterium]|jgi:hypothetical protein|nr:hypothetical protein [Fibrobacterota bacterium]
MKKNVLSFAAALCAGWMALPANADLVRNPTAVGGSFDFGQIVKGTLYDGSDIGSATKGDDQQITRTGVYLTESGTYNERLTIQLTVGGLFWFALPERDKNGVASFQTTRIYFGPGVGQAQGTYMFGSDPKNPVARLQFGLFGHKYSESVNLGEYLYRSGTYPGVLTSGGWSYINAASYLAQGARLTIPMLGGNLTHDITMYMERDLEPTNDISPGYVVSYKPLPFLELGAGIVWAHGISFNSDRLAPKKDANAYSKITNRPIKGADARGDTATANTPQNQIGYYTFKGFKTMGRLSLDLGALLGVDPAHSGDFKLYSEIALLGIEDQPYYYEKKSERMPVMGGISVPTFGLLDQLSFELEYHKSKFPNTNGSLLQGQLPIPINYGEDPYVYDESNYTGAAKDSVEKLWEKDDVKWTVYARRRIVNGLSVFVQAADDHLRHFNFAATPSTLPATSRPSDWYYVVRLEFGI